LVPINPSRSRKTFESRSTGETAAVALFPLTENAIEVWISPRAEVIAIQ
jgi:hypothetical protein